MKTIIFLLLTCVTPVYALSIGVSRTEITPPIGTPSAGYFNAKREMNGVHDPLTATALVIDSEGNKIAFCAVDHLGFDHAMVEAIREKVPGIAIFIGSSHTHSGAGAYLPIPLIGEMLAGPYNPQIRQMLIDQTATAILEAAASMEEGEIGCGYATLSGLNFFRSAPCPTGNHPPEDVAVIKCVSKGGKTLAVLFNFAVHPTVLSAQNTLYSADFVGYARDFIEAETGALALYFNGAQAEIIPLPPSGETEFERCASLGQALALRVNALCDEIVTSEAIAMTVLEKRYSFPVQPTSTGLKIPLESYDSEVNVIVFNERDAFVTIPGELSALYIEDIKSASPYAHLSILGLTNDAHGYILRPEAFHNQTPESRLSFGGPDYGDWLIALLRTLFSGV